MRKLVGQVDIGITLDTYSHFAPHKLGEAAERIGLGLKAVLGQ